MPESVTSEVIVGNFNYQFWLQGGFHSRQPAGAERLVPPGKKRQMSVARGKQGARFVMPTRFAYAYNRSGYSRIAQ